MSPAIAFAALTGMGLAWFIFFLIALAILLWFISWVFFPVDPHAPVNTTLANLPGLDETMAAKLLPYGIETDQDLVRLTPRGQQELESQLGLYNGEYDAWKREILSRWRSQYLPQEFRDIDQINPSPELGGLYTRRPKEMDDLTQLQEVDKGTAMRMQNAGIYTFEQLRLMMPEQRACLKQKFNLPAFNFDNIPKYGVTAEWLSFLAKEPADRTTGRSRVAKQTPSDNSIVASSFASSQAIRTASEGNTAINAFDTASVAIPLSIYDPDLGRIYSLAPPHRDDLTRLRGIDASTARRLNDAGVFTIDQVQSLNLSQREKFKRRFDLPHFDFSQWASGIQAPAVNPPHFSLQRESPNAALPSSPSSPAEDSPASANLASSSAKQRHVSDVASTAPVSQYASGANPIKVAGFSAATGGSSSGPALTAATTGSQYSSGPTPAVATGNFVADFASRLPTEIPASESSVSEIVASPLGPIYVTRPEQVDDLAQLPGIDALTAQAMNQAGIYRFSQIQKMSLAQQTQMRVRFGLGDAPFDEWNRLIHAWSRDLATSVDLAPNSQRVAWLHQVRLPQIAKNIFDGQALVAYPEQVVFRGRNAAFWGQGLDGMRRDVAISLTPHEVRHDFDYVRVRRMDTRQSVVVATCKADFFRLGDPDQNGWHGLGERFFDAYHLGIYARELPAEVETNLGFGGWGFGHQADESAGQEFCWGGRLIPPTTFEISVGRIGHASNETCVFRGSDPTIWNHDVRGSGNCFARSLSNVDHPVRFVRLKRMDTGQAVIAPVDGAMILRRGHHPQFGWTGLNDHCFGAYHLGIYTQCQNPSVEVAYGKSGGYGFGHHRSTGREQAYSWGEQKLPTTDFEISVLDTLPNHLGHELVG